LSELNCLSGELGSDQHNTVQHIDFIDIDAG